MPGKWLHVITFASATAMSAAGADGLSMGAPVLGYNVSQSPAEVRPILGVPGAALLAGPVPLPRGIRRLTAAPGQDFGLVDGIDAGPAIFKLDGGTRDAAVPITGAAETVDFVRFSPTGRTVVLFSRTAGRLQVATDLALRPHVRWEIDIAALPEDPVDAAVSDSGGTVLVASERAVYRVIPGGAVRLVVSVAESASLAFLPDSATAAIGDRGTGCVWILDGAPGAPNFSMLAAGVAGLYQMAATRDGSTLYVTDRERPRLWAVGIAGGTVEEVALPTLAESLYLMRSPDTYLISARPGEPSWILFRKDGRAATVFVPGVQDRAAHPPDVRNGRRGGS